MTITLSNINEQVTVEQEYTMLHAIVMLLLDAFIHFFLALYVEAVFPGSDGRAKRWYFPIQVKCLYFSNMHNTCQ